MRFSLRNSADILGLVFLAALVLAVSSMVMEWRAVAIFAGALLLIDSIICLCLFIKGDRDCIDPLVVSFGFGLGFIVFNIMVFGPSAQAGASDADKVNEQQYRDGQAHVLAEAKPLDQHMTLSDSKECVWEVWEDNGTLKLTRYTKPDGTPVCAAKQPAN